jgi:molybdenum cofactor guanylyltransferase
MTIIGVVLAGGKSRRMGAGDKAELLLGGRRLIDWAVERLSPQTDTLIISGASDYGLAFDVVGDQGDAGAGPLAGVHAALSWTRQYSPDAAGIVTVPVDGPFFPSNLVDRLSGEGAALVETADGLQPTFAYWPKGALGALEKLMAKGEPGAVRDFAKSIDARIIRFDDASHFFNINTTQDYELISGLECSGER